MIANNCEQIITDKLHRIKAKQIGVIRSAREPVDKDVGIDLGYKNKKRAIQKHSMQSVVAKPLN